MLNNTLIILERIEKITIGRFCGCRPDSLEKELAAMSNPEFTLRSRKTPQF
jgi:hypothetical protein